MEEEGRGGKGREGQGRVGKGWEGEGRGSKGTEGLENELAWNKGGQKLFLSKPNIHFPWAN